MHELKTMKIFHNHITKTVISSVVAPEIGSEEGTIHNVYKATWLWAF